MTATPWPLGSAASPDITLTVIKRTQAHVFRILPRRWVVERTFGWLLRYRRLVRDYERLPSITKPWCTGPPS